MFAKRIGLVVLMLAVLVMLLGSAPVAPADVPQDNHFTIVQGIIVGGAQPVTVTLRMDNRTGTTWLLQTRTEPGISGKRHIEWAQIEEFAAH